MVLHRAVRSNRNRIVFPYRIECFCSNRMRLSIFDTIRFDLNWKVNKKPWIVKVENQEFTKRNRKRNCQIFLPFWWIIPLKFDRFLTAIFFSWLLGRSFYRIESYLNRIDIESNRIERFLQLIDRKSNRIQFDLTALVLLQQEQNNQYRSSGKNETLQLFLKQHISVKNVHSSLDQSVTYTNISATILVIFII
jgi:hypothetical protein